MSREKVTSSKSRQSLTREVFIFKRNVDFLVGCQISLYRLQTSNILILIFSPQYSQLHIIPGRSSVRYLFCRQARQAIFLSQCFLLFLLWSVRKGNWTPAICTFLLKRPIDLQDLKSLYSWSSVRYLCADKQYSYLNVSLCSCSEALGKDIEHCTSNLYFSIKKTHPKEIRHHLTSCSLRRIKSRKDLLTTRMIVRRTQEVNMMAKLSRNQEIQWTLLPSPITLIVSFSRISFSCTIDLMIMEAE